MIPHRPRLHQCALPLLLLAGAAGAQLGLDTGSLVLETFRTRGVADDGKTTWLLEGARARLEGPVVHLQDARLTYTRENGETTVITTPAVAFDRGDRHARSDAPLRVVHRQAVITGVGYDLLAGGQKLLIRSQVRMTLPAGTVPLPKPPEKPAPPSGDPSP
ncbi:MAG: hypothetical protein WC789_02960 [Lentisphaeria bacterium]|jgi:hypothetical protein